MSSTMFKKTYCRLNYSQVFTKESIKSYSKRSDKKKVQPSIVHSLNATNYFITVINQPRPRSR